VEQPVYLWIDVKSELHTKHAGLVQHGHHHHLIEMQPVLSNDIAEKLLIWH